MNTKTQKDHTKHEYSVILEKRWDEDKKEHYYIAYHEEISRYGCYGRGRTPTEATKSLDRERYDLFAILMDKGVPIPEPSTDDRESLPSGKLLVRMDPILHRRLNAQAKRMGISLNLLVNRLLAQNSVSEGLGYDLNRRLDQIETKIDFYAKRFLPSSFVFEETGDLGGVEDSDKFRLIGDRPTRAA